MQQLWTTTPRSPTIETTSNSPLSLSYEKSGRLRRMARKRLGPTPLLLLTPFSSGELASIFSASIVLSLITISLSLPPPGAPLPLPFMLEPFQRSIAATKASLFTLRLWRLSTICRYTLSSSLLPVSFSAELSSTAAFGSTVGSDGSLSKTTTSGSCATAVGRNCLGSSDGVGGTVGGAVGGGGGSSIGFGGAIDAVGRSETARSRALTGGWWCCVGAAIRSR